MRKELQRWSSSVILVGGLLLLSGAAPQVANADQYCGQSGQVYPSSDAADRFWGGQCYDEGSYAGIDGYVRLSAAAFGPGDAFVSDWLSLTDAALGHVQAGMDQSDEHPNLGAVSLFSEATTNAYDCLPDLAFYAKSRANTAVYIMDTGVHYLYKCGLDGAIEIAYRFGSLLNRPKGYGLLVSIVMQGAKEEHAFHPGYTPAYTGGQNFGLNDLGQYDAGYSVHLWDHYNWVLWSFQPTWTGNQTGVVPGTPIPANPLSYGSVNQWNSFHVVDTSR